MQMLTDTLTEFGEHAGLSWIRGRVVTLSELTQERVRIPHMGWSTVDFSGPGEHWGRKIGRRKDFYFAHSFAIVPESEDVVAAWVDHGGAVVAAITWDSVLATQFHPEKSEVPGAGLIEAFVDWTP